MYFLEAIFRGLRGHVVRWIPFWKIRPFDRLRREWSKLELFMASDPGFLKE